MNKEEYIKNVEKLNYYTRKYDEGNPEISDEEWDNLYFDCCVFEEESGYVDPKSPSATIQFRVKNNLKKVTHNHLMLSLDKTKDINVLKKWLKEDSIVMLKMDGLTCSLKYVDGKLVSAETRGNGTVGEDVTNNALTIKSIPKTIDASGTVIIDGEVICKYDDFEEFSGIYKNPRNFASGSIRLDDAEECGKRKLSFIAWDLISSTDNLDVKLKKLDLLGFEVVPWDVTSAALEDQQESLRKIAAMNYYPIDGLVYKINDYNSYMDKGHDDHAFHGGFAFKLYDQEYETALINIDWSVSKTGTITPVAVFKPVNIDGAIIQRASMHNISIMHELLGHSPYIGQKLWIIRANMVIPQVVRAEKNN